MCWPARNLLALWFRLSIVAVSSSVDIFSGFSAEFLKVFKYFGENCRPNSDFNHSKGKHGIIALAVNTVQLA